MCNCRQEKTAAILGRFQAENPTLINHTVRLMGYALFPSHNCSKEQGVMHLEMVAEEPLPHGNTRKATIKISIAMEFCPFCGEKY